MLPVVSAGGQRTRVKARMADIVVIGEELLEGHHVNRIRLEQDYDTLYYLLDFAAFLDGLHFDVIRFHQVAVWDAVFRYTPIRANNYGVIGNMY